jgi:hypothetical protein
MKASFSLTNHKLEQENLVISESCLNNEKKLREMSNEIEDEHLSFHSNATKSNDSHDTNTSQIDSEILNDDEKRSTTPTSVGSIKVVKSERKRTANLESLIGNLKVRKLNQNGTEKSNEKKLQSLYVDTSLSECSTSTPPLSSSSPSVSPSSLPESPLQSHLSSVSSTSLSNLIGNNKNSDVNKISSMLPKYRWMMESSSSTKQINSMNTITKQRVDKLIKKECLDENEKASNQTSQVNNEINTNKLISDKNANDIFAKYSENIKNAIDFYESNKNYLNMIKDASSELLWTHLANSNQSVNHLSLISPVVKSNEPNSHFKPSQIEENSINNKKPPKQSLPNKQNLAKQNGEKFDAISLKSNSPTSTVSSQKNQEDPTRAVKFYDDFIDFRGDILRKPPNSKNCRILWEYLYLLLQDSNYSSVIKWEDESNMVFRIVQAEKLAALWGLQKNRLGMTYEKLSRGMRYYYPNNIIAREPGRRLLYRFMRHPDDIKKFVKKNGTYMLKRAKMDSSLNDTSKGNEYIGDDSSDEEELKKSEKQGKSIKKTNKNQKKYEEEDEMEEETFEETEEDLDINQDDLVIDEKEQKEVDKQNKHNGDYFNYQEDEDEDLESDMRKSDQELATQGNRLISATTLPTRGIKNGDNHSTKKNLNTSSSSSFSSTSSSPNNKVHGPSNTQTPYSDYMFDPSYIYSAQIAAYLARLLPANLSSPNDDMNAAQFLMQLRNTAAESVAAAAAANLNEKNSKLISDLLPNSMNFQNRSPFVNSFVNNKYLNQLEQWTKSTRPSTKSEDVSSSSPSSLSSVEYDRDMMKNEYEFNDFLTKNKHYQSQHPNQKLPGRHTNNVNNNNGYSNMNLKFEKADYSNEIKVQNEHPLNLSGNKKRKSKYDISRFNNYN